MEGTALREFLADTAWGALDVLLIDLPPGADRLPTLLDLLPGLTGRGRGHDSLRRLPPGRAPRHDARARARGAAPRADREHGRLRLPDLRDRRPALRRAGRGGDGRAARPAVPRAACRSTRGSPRRRTVGGPSCWSTGTARPGGRWRGSRTPSRRPSCPDDAPALSDRLPRPSAERLAADLRALEAFTRPDRPYTRRAFSDEDRAARQWLAGRMAEAGLVPTVDAGREPDRAAGRVGLGAGPHDRLAPRHGGGGRPVRRDRRRAGGPRGRPLSRRGRPPAPAPARGRQLHLRGAVRLRALDDRQPRDERQARRRHRGAPPRPGGADARRGDRLGGRPRGRARRRPASARATSPGTSSSTSSNPSRSTARRSRSAS